MTFDTTAIDEHMNQLNKREIEITRQMRLENFKREVPLTVLLWLARLGAIALVIFVLGFAINKAMSWERSNINKTIIEELPLNPIDRTKLESPEFPEGVGIEVPEGSIRNYYLFDHVPFEGLRLQEVIIGRIYDAPGEEPYKIYCYITWQNKESFSKKIELVNISNDQRFETEINQEISESTGISIKELKDAQEACGI